MSFSKNIRHYYWLLSAFARKNIKFLSISFIGGFLIILTVINTFPLINTLFIEKKQIIGLVDKVGVENLPQEILSQVSNPLIVVDQYGEIFPVLAESYEVLEKGTRYRFKLKKDLFWTDKKQLTAHDLKFNLQDVVVTVVDDHTIDFKLKQQLIIFPIYLTKPILKYPLVGIGAPYSIQSYKVKKDQVTYLYLSPNKPELQPKIYRFYNTEEDLINGYKKGEINYFKTSNRKIADVFTKWKNTKVDKDVDYSQIVTLFMNTQAGILQERDVRKGLAYASPQFKEFGIKAKSPIPPTSWAYTQEVKDYTQNTERAKTLIEKNLSASESSTLKMYTFFDYVDVAEAMKTEFEATGLKINLKIASYLPKDFDLLLTAWSPPNDPDQYFFWHSTQAETNLTKFKNDKVDKLLEDGRRVLNVKQRKNIYADFQKAITDELPSYFVYHPYVYVINRK